jgi:hypothetical protein
MEHWLNDSARGKPKLRKTLPSATLFTRNPTLTNRGMNPRLGGGMPATNHLNHDTALKLNFMSLLLINSIPT